MTVREFVKIVETMAGMKADPHIEVFTNVSRPADLISIEYEKVNNIIYLKYETEGEDD